MAIKRDVQICAKLRPREAEAVKALADRQGVTISEFIRDALNSKMGYARGFSSPETMADDTVSQGV